MIDETNSPGTAEGSDPADAGPDLVTLPRAELEALRATAQAEAARKEREAELARQVAERDRQAADWQEAYRGAVRDRELATALAGRPLVAGAAAQLLTLWRDEFDVIEEDGRPRVVGRDGRPVDRAVDEKLARPEFAHFRPPASRGGTATPGGHRNVAAPAVPPAPGTLGEALLRRWREAPAPAVADPSAPVGLGRRR